MILVIVLMIIVINYLQHPLFWAKPSGERLLKMQQSPNFRNGQFHNLSETPMITSDQPVWKNFYNFLFKDRTIYNPYSILPIIKTDLKNLDPDQNVLVWLGHSTYFIQIDGKKFLVDPSLVSASPIPFINQPFGGTTLYHPKDIPFIDYLIISHDHYDHLDYYTVSALKDTIWMVIVWLGVGSHFERWGFHPKQIIELDRRESQDFSEAVRITALPARHFSGRLFSPNTTLRASYLLEVGQEVLYLGGDGGYDAFFSEIPKNFSPITLAILENGQYDERWKYIHTLPEQLPRLIHDLQPQRVMTIHNSKYTLWNHPWYEPLQSISKYAEEYSLPLIAPKIWEIVDLERKDQPFEKWREEVK